MVLYRLLKLQLLLAACATAFSFRCSTETSSVSTTRLAAKGFGKSSSSGQGGGQGGGQGFGNNGGRAPEKTYDKVATRPRADLIDSESAMREFFSANEEWHPLFLNVASHPSVPAMSFLGNTMDPTTGISAIFDFDNTQDSDPWRRLDGIPSDESERQVLANVLDNMQASLIDIPVTEGSKEDDNDLQFLEEGRRLLAISRFHVLQGVTGGSVECYDSLFSTCWSELMELKSKDEASTGSLIVVPDYEISDLKRFTDMNLLRPLEWLGLQEQFEVTSLHRGSPAIRLLHKLEDMPDEPWNESPMEDVES